MKKRNRMLLSVLLVLAMVLSGFAAGGAGGLRVSAAEKDMQPVTVLAGQQYTVPEREAEGWVFKGLQFGDVLYAPDETVDNTHGTEPMVLTPVWISEEEDTDPDEELLGGGSDSGDGEGYSDGEGVGNSDEVQTPASEGGEGDTDAPVVTGGEGGEGDAPVVTDGEGDTPIVTDGEGGEGDTPVVTGGENGEGDAPAVTDGENGEGGEGDAPVVVVTDGENGEGGEGDAPVVTDGEKEVQTPAVEAAPAAEEPAVQEEPASPETVEEPAAEEAEEAETEESNLKLAPYTVSFDLSGKEGTKPEDQKFTEEGKTVTKPEDPKATGYTFKEWCKDKELTAPYDFTAVVAESFTLYANWTANTYTVKFDANGGTGTMADETGFEYDVEKALTKNAFTREEYEFSGWNTKADGSGDPYADEAKVKNLTAEDKATVTLYAQWKSTKKYTVTFDANGRGTAPAAQTVTSGEKATEPAKPTATGYTCNGWYTDKECKSAYDFATAVTADVTLYAGWTANKYTIHFDPNGGTTGSMADMTCTYDVKTNLTKNAFGRGEDWMFIGWNTKADRTGTAYADQAEVLNLTAENNGKITLYAQWKFIYRVIAGANGVVSKLNTQGITFQTNGNAALFTGITVDGVAVNGNLYSAWAGSKGGTFVNLKQDFVKTLSIGTHTINFLYSDGSCSTAFTVNNSNVINPASTGDNSHMALYTALLAGAAVLIGGLAFLRKRYWK